MVEWISVNWKEIVIGAFVISRVIVMLTPTETDNKILEKVRAFLLAVGLHVKD